MNYVFEKMTLFLIRFNQQVAGQAHVQNGHLIDGNTSNTSSLCKSFTAPTKMSLTLSGWPYLEVKDISTQGRSTIHYTLVFLSTNSFADPLAAMFSKILSNVLP